MNPSLNGGNIGTVTQLFDVFFVDLEESDALVSLFPALNEQSPSVVYIPCSSLKDFSALSSILYTFPILSNAFLDAVHIGRLCICSFCAIEEA